MISIIIVNYKVKEKVLKSIESIYNSNPETRFEMIIVDNSRDSYLRKALVNKFPKVKYIKSKKNLGFGAGNNLGAKYAKGEYLFFLNPDTEVLGKTVDILYKFLEKNKEVAIVSPLILGKDKKPLDRQGYKELNFINGIFTFTYFRKKFPQFSISSFYSSDDWRKDPIKKVETVYGAALMIRAKIFNQVKGFDEDYFLFFEENDLSKRVRSLGYKLFINSNAKIIHEVGQSTKQLKERDEYFEKSRFLYFKKNFGILQACFFELVLKINKYSILLLGIFLISLFLRIYNLQNSMQFIGDQGWFYLSARDLLINGTIPLVGITSSHTWLHQGPLWTYMLSIALLIGRFNPISAAYLTAIIGSLTVILIYKITSRMFSGNAGILAAVLYAVSPLIVFFDRIPFDPAPIPFFTTLYLYSLYRWINNSLKYFPVLIFSIAILYNLELATFTLFFPFVAIFLYGVIKKEEFVTKLNNKKIVLISIASGVVPMLPVIIYDFSHGFKQTIVFFAWTIYKPINGIIGNNSSDTSLTYKSVILFLSQSIQNIVFHSNMMLALLIFLLSVVFLVFKFFSKTQSVRKPEFLILFLLIVSFLGLLVNKIPSDAYLPIIFPFVIISVGTFFSYLLNLRKLKYVLFALFLILIFLNIKSSIIQSQNSNFTNRLDAVSKVIALSKNQKYNLVGQGPGSQFESFTMNYEYLLWWKGHPVSDKKEHLKIIVKETGSKIEVLTKK